MMGIFDTLVNRILLRQIHKPTLSQEFFKHNIEELKTNYDPQRVSDFYNHGWHLASTSFKAATHEIKLSIVFDGDLSNHCNHVSSPFSSS